MNKIVIYTAIFGHRDTLSEPEFIPKDCDFICFTDNNFKSNIWKIIKVSPPLADPVRSARKYKILGHKYLPDYKYSVWIDGNIVVRGDVNRLIKNYLTDCHLAVYNHACLKVGGRNCVYQEAQTLIDLSKTCKYKDDPELIKKQMAKYRAEHYPSKNGLVCSSVMLCEHNQADVIMAMEAWWQELDNFSRRDQLSFNYIAWKQNLNFVYLDGDCWDNDFFYRRYHFVFPVKKLVNYLRYFIRKLKAVKL